MRLIFAIWAAKLAAALGILMGKKSSSTPGEIALKICPDIIEKLKKNIKNKVFITCGTNGKTTTNNLLCSSLENLGYKVLCNKVGANMLSGVANVFALSANIFGKISADYACFEVDEAYATKVFDKIVPDVMIITNLFRDQLDRYGEIETTAKLLSSAIEKGDDMTLILNGDDPICTQFKKIAGNVRFFGISEKVLDGESDVKEGRYCTECKKELSYNYNHYNQLGDFYCTGCENKRPKIDFEAKDVSLTDGLKFTVNNCEKISVTYKGFYNIYNILAVYAALKSSGVETGDFSALLSNYKPQIGRMEEIMLQKPVILNLAKNPAGFNQAVMTVKEDRRKKDIVIAVNDAVSDGQDISWLWDVEFEKLIDENTGLLITGGRRRYDLSLRFKYAEAEVSLCTLNMKEAINKCLESDSEVVYVLVNYTALFSTQNTLLEMKKEIGDGKNE